MILICCSNVADLSQRFDYLEKYTIVLTPEITIVNYTPKKKFVKQKILIQTYLILDLLAISQNLHRFPQTICGQSHQACKPPRVAVDAQIGLGGRLLLLVRPPAVRTAAG